MARVQTMEQGPDRLRMTAEARREIDFPSSVGRQPPSRDGTSGWKCWHGLKGESAGPSVRGRACVRVKGTVSGTVQVKVIVRVKVIVSGTVQVRVKVIVSGTVQVRVPQALNPIAIPCF